MCLIRCRFANSESFIMKYKTVIWRPITRCKNKLYGTYDFVGGGLAIEGGFDIVSSISSSCSLEAVCKLSSIWSLS